MTVASTPHEDNVLLECQLVSLRGVHDNKQAAKYKNGSFIDAVIII